MASLRSAAPVTEAAVSSGTCRNWTRRRPVNTGMDSQPTACPASRSPSASPMRTDSSRLTPNLRNPGRAAAASQCPRKAYARRTVLVRIGRSQRSGNSPDQALGVQGLIDSVRPDPGHATAIGRPWSFRRRKCRPGAYAMERHCDKHAGGDVASPISVLHQGGPVKGSAVGIRLPRYPHRMLDISA